MTETELIIGSKTYATVNHETSEKGLTLDQGNTFPHTRVDTMDCDFGKVEKRNPPSVSNCHHMR